ncbi:hypothetical protein [Kitasatospora atroaurantiaca]|uniref:Uncharacterized protein n=1 Tax=Kitasatospora atroaurantiaca TaxID=285545 RepID=A0A561EXA9_9ACTN|nr:hypothetical protein [Kitasatospora atroaurantiaca]TWE20252.1 hypothetical protein FB465_5398 [Kitasatospora atroaurantiaca]
MLDPLAVPADGLVIPDLAAGDAASAPAPTAPRTTDPITLALESSLSALADLAHTGLRGLGRSEHDRLAGAASDLRRTGLDAGAALVQAVATTLANESADASVAPWADAAIHLLVALELHQEADLSHGASPVAIT